MSKQRNQKIKIKIDLNKMRNPLILLTRQKTGQGVHGLIKYKVRRAYEKREFLKELKKADYI